MVGPVGVQFSQMPLTHGDTGLHSSISSSHVGPVQPSRQEQLNSPGPVGYVCVCVCVRAYMCAHMHACVWCTI